MKYSGNLIVLEGPECSGKTSVCKLLKTLLEEESHEVILLLSHTDGYKNLAAQQRKLFLDPYLASRMDDTTTALCFAAARRDMINNTILPALKSGKMVVMDRWVLSTLSIQRDVENVLSLIEFTTTGLVPNYTFILDIPVNLTINRLNNRPEQQDVLDMVPRSEHTERRKAYLDLPLYKKYLDTDRNDVSPECHIIDASKITIEQTANKIFKQIMSTLV